MFEQFAPHQWCQPGDSFALVRIGVRMRVAIGREGAWRDITRYVADLCQLPMDHSQTIAAEGELAIIKVVLPHLPINQAILHDV